MPLKRTLTKLELAEQVAELGISRRFARKVVDAFLADLLAALRRGETVHVVGFGAFHFKDRGPRRGRNPRTGAQVQVPAKRILHFRPSNQLRTAVRAFDAK